MDRRPVIILGLLLCLPASAAPQADSGPPADILAVRNIEIIFHTAGSVLPNKDLDLMMSLYADDVVLTDTAHDNKLYQAKNKYALTGRTSAVYSAPSITGLVTRRQCELRVA
jgi:hypothetical protein